jgi:hypothetical protein
LIGDSWIVEATIGLDGQGALVLAIAAIYRLKQKGKTARIRIHQFRFKITGFYTYTTSYLKKCENSHITAKVRDFSRPTVKMLITGNHVTYFGKLACKMFLEI